MPENSLPSTCGVALCAICVFAASAGCTGERHEVPAARPGHGVLLRVVEEVYDGGWTIAGGIVVKGDGSYRQTNRDLSKKNSTFVSIEGHLPDHIIRALEEDVSKKTGFEIADGAPTYKYGVDNHHVLHPVGIGQLLRFIAESGEKEGRTQRAAERRSDEEQDSDN